MYGTILRIQFRIHKYIPYGTPSTVSYSVHNSARGNICRMQLRIQKYIMCAIPYKEYSVCTSVYESLSLSIYINSIYTAPYTEMYHVYNSAYNTMFQYMCFLYTNTYTEKYSMYVFANGNRFHVKNIYSGIAHGSYAMLYPSQAKP